MERFFAPENKSAVEALYDAQRLAFAPSVFQATRALRELGILEAVQKAGEAGLSLEAIALQVDLSEYGVGVLLESGLSAGVVSVSDSRFTLTKTGYFILNDPMTRANMDYNHFLCFQGLYFLEDAVRTGNPTGLKVFGDWKTIYPALTTLPEEARESWFRFNHFYSDRAFPHALPLVLSNQPRNLLDIGGNTGRWAISCARYSDRVSVTIVDLPEQLAVARQAIAESALEHRISCLELDLLESSSSLPKGFDVIWMSQFLDCFGPEDIVRLLELTAQAMDERTRLYILEPLWDRQRHEMSAYCLLNTSLYFTCIANGKSRMYHSRDVRRFVHQAGLTIVREWDDLGICHSLLECEKL
jgi:ubiquinone/menaquinone biosynthesis C-methylase UbiE